MNIQLPSKKITVTPPSLLLQELKKLLEDLRLNPTELLPPLASLGVDLVEVVRPPDSQLELLTSSAGWRAAQAMGGVVLLFK